MSGSITFQTTPEGSASPAIIMPEDGAGSVHFAAAVPSCTCQVRIAPYFYVEQPVMPNHWWRFWQWALLGWTWEKI